MWKVNYITFINNIEKNDLGIEKNFLNKNHKKQALIEKIDEFVCSKIKSFFPLKHPVEWKIGQS